MPRGIYKIGTLSRLTGVPQSTLRSWELRLGLLDPYRTDGLHRLYSDEDVRCVLAAKTLVAEGRSIGEVAALGRETLLEHAPPPDAVVATSPAQRATASAKAVETTPLDAATVLDCLDEPMIVVSATGLVLVANAPVATLLGWSPAELVGRRLTSFLRGRPHAGRVSRLRAIRRDGAEVEVDAKVARGKVLVVSLRRRAAASL